MGASGTDVARDAADLALLDDDFGTIVEAVQHGWITFSNMGSGALDAALRSCPCLRLARADHGEATRLIAWDTEEREGRAPSSTTES
jgi:hypothetical protein